MAVVGALLLAGGCREKPVEQPDVIARIGEATITGAALRKELSKRNAGMSPEQRRVVFDEMVRTEVLYARARAAGLDQDSEMKLRWKRMIAAEYEERERTKQPAGKTSDKEVEAYYQARAAEFKRAARWRVAGLFLKVPKKAQPEKKAEFEREAAGLLEAARTNTAQFAELVRLHSEDGASRYRGGDLGLLGWKELVQRFGPEVAQNLTNLTVGEFGGPFQGPDGLWIARIVEHAPESVTPLVNVRSVIEHRLTQAGKQAADKSFNDRMREGIKVEIDEAAVGQILAKTNAPAASPPPLSGR